jgi:hypothetical protein
MSVPNNANLQWSIDEKFEIPGKDLELLVQVVRAQLNTPEAQRIMSLQMANEALNNVLDKGIQDNKIALVPPPEEQKSTEATSSSY